MDAMPKKSPSWIIIVIILFVLLIAAGAWMYWRKAPAGEELMMQESAGSPIDFGNDITASIETDLNATNMGDIDSEFQAVDQDIQNL